MILLDEKMIDTLGKNLDILLLTTPGLDWQAFATWYSAYKNLPDAKFVMVCVRNKNIEFKFYQWAKKLSIPLFFTNHIHDDPLLHRLSMTVEAVKRGLIKEKALIITPKIMFIDVFDELWLHLLNQENKFWLTDQELSYTNGLDKSELEAIMDDYELTGGLLQPLAIVPEAKEDTELSSVVSYGNGCGKWKEGMRGCPFSNVTSLCNEGMTVNERRIVELWRKMNSLYSIL